MTMTILPEPEGSYTLKISLALIAAIENNHGSIYQLAEKLLDKSLGLAVIISVLKSVYRAAGRDVAEEFLLQQPCAELLTSVLLDILGPVERLGAVQPGEPSPAAKSVST